MGVGVAVSVRLRRELPPTPSPAVTSLQHYLYHQKYTASGQSQALQQPWGLEEAGVGGACKVRSYNFWTKVVSFGESWGCASLVRLGPL